MKRRQFGNQTQENTDQAPQAPPAQPNQGFAPPAPPTPPQYQPTPPQARVPQRTRTASAEGFQNSGSVTASQGSLDFIEEPGVVGTALLLDSRLYAGEKKDFARIEFLVLESNSPMHPQYAERGDLWPLDLPYDKATVVAKGVYNAFLNEDIDQYTSPQQDACLNDMFTNLHAQAQGEPTDAFAGTLAHFKTYTHTTEKGQDIVLTKWSRVPVEKYQQFRDAVSAYGDYDAIVSELYG